jgi:hypothetical protein
VITTTAAAAAAAAAATTTTAAAAAATACYFEPVLVSYILTLRHIQILLLCIDQFFGTESDLFVRSLSSLLPFSDVDVSAHPLVH